MKGSLLERSSTDGRPETLPDRQEGNRRSGKVLVAMSGGVDSSVAAALLVKQGYEVLGVTMRLFCYADRVPDRPCCSLGSISDAASVAARFEIPHYVLDFADQFKRDVIQDFVSEYASGRTPIPCVRCNSLTKFRDLMSHADALGCDYIATGHYAIARDGALYRGRDPDKDQTYFLWGISQAVVQRMLTPLGDLTKQETRQIARELHVVTADKKESVEVCFVPDNDYMTLLRQHLPANSPALTPGPIVTSRGDVVGEHDGYARYTIGQRRGLPGGLRSAMYVTAIRPETREVVIGPRTELFDHSLEIEDLNWLSSPLDRGARCVVQVRYRSKPVPARVSNTATVQQGRLVLELAEPVCAATPGQSGVLYREDGRLLGGGVINRTGAVL